MRADHLRRRGRPGQGGPANGRPDGADTTAATRARIRRRTRDRVALVLAHLLLTLLRDDGLAHAAVDVAAERRERGR